MNSDLTYWYDNNCEKRPLAFSSPVSFTWFPNKVIVLRPPIYQHLFPAMTLSLSDMLHQLHVLEACMLNTLSSRLHASMEKDDDLERAKIVELRQTAFEHLEGGGK